MNRIGDSYQARLKEYQQIAQANNFVISLTENSHEIESVIREIVNDATNSGFIALRDQVKFYTTSFTGSDLVKGVPTGF